MSVDSLQMLSSRQRRVDLMGRLSNPPEAVTTIVEQGRREQGWISRSSGAGVTAAPGETRRHPTPQETRGRLSNPVLRRPTDAQIRQVVDQYRDGGDSIDSLSRRYKVHRGTVMHHVANAGIAHRRTVRKMSDESVAAAAAAQYEAGARSQLWRASFMCTNGPWRESFAEREYRFDHDEVGTLNSHGEYTCQRSDGVPRTGTCGSPVCRRDSTPRKPYRE